MQVSTKLCVVNRENKVNGKGRRKGKGGKGKLKQQYKKSIFQNAMRRNQTDIGGKFMCVYLPLSRARSARASKY